MLGNIEKIMAEIWKELDRAQSLHPLWPGHDLVHAAAIVSEESGELIRAALRHQYAEGGTLDDVKAEAVQTATTCIRLLMNLEGKEMSKNVNDDYVVYETLWKTKCDDCCCGEGEDDDYASLVEVMEDAVAQAQNGKGLERHANGEPFEDQKICRGARQFGIGGPLFQASKKIDEAHRMATSGNFKHGTERAVQELLGAINYIAAAVIVLREE